MRFEEEYFKRVYGDYYSKSPAYKFRAILNEISKYKNEGKLLDVGCAYGRFLEVVSSQFKNRFSITGIDVSKHAIAIAKKNLSTSRLKVCSVEKTTFKNKSFDVITLLDVIEHVPNLEKSFIEVKSILKENGIVVILVPVYDGITGKIVNLIDKDYTHIHKKSRRFWADKLKKYFTILESIGVIRFKFPFFYLHYQNKYLSGIVPAVLFVLKKK